MRKAKKLSATMGFNLPDRLTWGAVSVPRWGLAPKPSLLAHAEREQGKEGEDGT